MGLGTRKVLGREGKGGMEEEEARWPQLTGTEAVRNDQPAHHRPVTRTRNLLVVVHEITDGEAHLLAVLHEGIKSCKGYVPVQGVEEEEEEKRRGKTDEYENEVEKGKENGE